MQYYSPSALKTKPHQNFNNRFVYFPVQKRGLFGKIPIQNFKQAGVTNSPILNIPLLYQLPLLNISFLF